jgi:hypothetical protein
MRHWQFTGPFISAAARPMACVLAAVLLGATIGATTAPGVPAGSSVSRTQRGPVVIKDRSDDSPLVLNQPVDYILRNVAVAGVRDNAALTLAGKVQSVRIFNGRFGDVLAGPNGRAAALDAAGANVATFVATDSQFYDAENQLASLRDGTFGTVRFERCAFRTSEPFLKQLYARSPWRAWPPVTEFFNIDRLELLDNSYENTIVVIHPSVKQVVIRGGAPQIQVQGRETQVIRLEAAPAGTASPA